MKKLACLLLFPMVTGLGATSADAVKPKFDLRAGMGVMSGDTTYEIGGEFSGSFAYTYRFPISELKFPLDVYMASAHGTLNFQDRWSIHVNGKKNITDDAGKLEDSDWGIWYEEGCPYCSSDSLDIFSESDAELDALIIDIDFHFWVYKKVFEKSDLSLF